MEKHVYSICDHHVVYNILYTVFAVVQNANIHCSLAILELACLVLHWHTVPCLKMARGRCLLVPWTRHLRWFCIYCNGYRHDYFIITLDIFRDNTWASSGFVMLIRLYSCKRLDMNEILPWNFVFQDFIKMYVMMYLFHKLTEVKADTEFLLNISNFVTVS